MKGEANPDTGFLVNLSDVSDIIQKYVLSKVDHRNLNLDVDFMQGKLPSTEILASEIWKILRDPINTLSCRLHCVKIQETAKNYVEYFGE